MKLYVFRNLDETMFEKGTQRILLMAANEAAAWDALMEAVEPYVGPRPKRWVREAYELATGPTDQPVFIYDGGVLLDNEIEL